MSTITTTTIKNRLANDDLHQKWVCTYRNTANSYFYEYVIDIAETLFCDKTKTILDAGCGTASHTIRFAKRGYSCIGVDFSEYALSLARKEIANTLRKNESPSLEHLITLQVEDITLLSFDSESIDYIFCWGVLIHIPEIEKAISELCRVLKPGGKLIIGVANKYSVHNIFFRLYRRLRGTEKTKKITKFGTELIATDNNGTFLTRLFSVPYLTKSFQSYGVHTTKRLSGQFTELYGSFPATSYCYRMIQAFNRFWIHIMKLPYLSLGNILLMEKSCG